MVSYPAMEWGRIDTPWGTFYAAGDGKGLAALRFPDSPPPPGPFTRPPWLARLECQLTDYLRGEPVHFRVPLSLKGTPFQISVWQALREIPYGGFLTYGELARRVGRPKGARAVGGAVGANPLPIIIPCHRVLGARGLGGYGPGLHWKKRLLELEGILGPGQKRPGPSRAL